MARAKEVSISKAREQLPSLVREAERGSIVTLTRRGVAVAVLISTTRFSAFDRRSLPLAGAIDDFRAGADLVELDIEAVYEDVRDTTRGRVVRL